MPSPVAGFTGSVKVGAAANPTNLVSDVTDIQVPFVRASYDTTSMNATNNGWQQFIAGLGSGKMTLKANYVPGDTTGQLVLTNAYVNSTLLYFIVSLNGAANTAAFTGYVESFNPHAPVNNKSDVSYGITITGAPTFT